MIEAGARYADVAEDVVRRGRRRYDSLPAGGRPEPDDDPDEWPLPTVTLNRAEVPTALVDGLYDENNRVDPERALNWARAGRPLLR
jgi:hypothetical protein